MVENQYFQRPDSGPAFLATNGDAEKTCQGQTLTYYGHYNIDSDGKAYHQGQTLKLIMNFKKLWP